MASNAPITGARRRAPNIPAGIVPALHARDTAPAVPDAPHLHLRVAPPRINRAFSVLAGRTTIASAGQCAPVAPRLSVPPSPKRHAAGVVARLQKDGLGEVGTAGDQPGLLLQRFELLDGGNRKVLMASALQLIERQEEAKLPPLPPRQARINKLIAMADHTIMQLGSKAAGDTIERRVMGGILDHVVAELAGFGIAYFGKGGGRAEGGQRHGC